MKKYALLGYPLKHSLSPQIHKRLFKLAGYDDFSYELIEIPSEELSVNIPMLNSLDGYNITIPHKVNIIRYIDELDESAERYNSVNCVSGSGGIITGYNTDCYGFLRALETNNFSLGGKVLQVGCGGAGRMTAVEAILRGAELTVAVLPDFIEETQIFINENLKLNTAAKAEVIANIGINGSFDLLVNASPVGMYPHNDECPVSEAVIKNCKSVFDVIYNPDVTKLMGIAEKNNIPSAGGMSMLVWQAVAAHKIWDGSEYSGGDIAELISDMQNELKRTE